MADKQTLPVVAILGRPNTGKSTLLNRLVGRRVSIVDPTSGVTRDRIYEEIEYDERRFLLCDLAGVDHQLSDPLNRETFKQVLVALEEALVVVLLVDGQTGIMPQDEEVARIARELDKPLILAVNKMDDSHMNGMEAEFHSLGLGLDPLPISAVQGRGIHDLLEQIVEHIEPNMHIDFDTPDDETIRIAIVGRQNVGKSSLLNAISGEERAVVSDIAGTTRDAVDHAFRFEDRDYVVIDTAGLKKKSKKLPDIDYYSRLRASDTLKRAEIAILVLSVEEGILETDQKIADLIRQSGCAVQLVANKWDLTEDTPLHRQEFTKHAKSAMHFFTFAPTVFTSALTGWNIGEVFKEVPRIHENFHRRVPTADLNRWLDITLEMNPPPTSKSKFPKFFYCTHAAVAPHQFVFMVNDAEAIKQSYKNFLENQIRQTWDFTGCPIKLVFRTRKRKKK